MNANPQFLAKSAHVDDAAIKPLPNSHKIYVQGSRPDIRVPMREITQTPTHTNAGAEQNPPIHVYDCSGPYSDPTVKIDIRSGLPPLREGWIAERNDTEQLTALSSHYGQQRLNDPELATMRFNLLRAPRKEKSALTSRRCITHAKASSHRKWSSWQFAKTRRSRTIRRAAHTASRRALWHSNP